MRCAPNKPPPAPFHTWCRPLAFRCVVLSLTLAAGPAWLLVGAAEAAIFEWVGLCPGTNDWFCISNWRNLNFDPQNPVFLPLPTDAANCDNGGTIEVGSGPASASSLTLGKVSLLGGNLLVRDGGELDIGSTLAVAKLNASTATMTGGHIAAGEITIGSSVIGSFDQSGGTISSPSVKLGIASGGEGNFSLSGGQLDAHVYVGVGGVGRLTQTGGQVGTASVRKEIRLGTAAGGSGIYTLNAGSVFATTTYIGLAANGAIVQNGGTYSGSSLGLTVGNDVGSSGTYELNAGVLTYAGPEYIGYRGSGLFSQSGGTHEPYGVHVGYYGNGTYHQTGGVSNVGLTSNGSMYAGTQTGSTGSIDISDAAELNIAQQLGIGISGVGRVQQSAGTTVHAGVSIYLGSNAGSVGTYVQDGGLTTIGDDLLLGIGGSAAYELRSGDLSMVDDLSIASNSSSVGVFRHTGGNNTVAGDLRLRGSGRGSYELSGNGSLIANTEYVSAPSGGTAQFFQTGGSNLATSRVCIACDGSASSGTYTLVGGSLRTRILQVSLPPSGGAANLILAGPSAQVTVDSLLILGPGSSVAAVPGAVIHMTGSTFDIQSTNEAALEGLTNMEMVFEGGSADIDPVEVAGVDMGPNWDGQFDNFALGKLTLGGADVGRIRLVNNRVNQPGAGTGEALYVRTLTIGPGSYLDLSGRCLYYQNATIDPAATIVLGGGCLTQISTPTAANGTIEARDRMLESAPNPFRAGTVLRFELRAPAHVTLQIFDATGRCVATLLDDSRSAGIHSVMWDGKDDAGKRISPGIHFARLVAGNRHETARMVLMK